MHRSTLLGPILLLSVSGVAAGQNAPAPSEPQSQGAQAPAAAAPADSPLAETRKTWTVQFEPSAWYVAPSGKIRLPSSTVKGSQVKLDELNMDSPRVSPAGELHLRTSDTWRFSAGAAYFSADNRNATMEFSDRLGDIVFVPGDTLQSKLDFFTAEITAAYAIVPEHAVGGDQDVLFGVDIVGGVRMYDVDWSTQQLGGAKDSYSQFFAEPILGIKLDATLCEKFTIDLQTNFGYLPAGDTETYSWDITVGFVYRPVEWLGVQIGYRNLFFNLQDGDGAGEFDWRGGMAGLYGGVELRF